MFHVLDALESELVTWLEAQQQRAFRARQICHWLFARRARSFEEMTDLPKTLQAGLADQFRIWSMQIAQHHKADDGTEKLLLELHDGGRIECVLLRDGRRRTVCISTQVGCAMGCVFCASGLGGVERNLSSGEIVEQMLVLLSLLPAQERISHVVVMGMGEPLANLDALLPALAMASSPEGLEISARRITISTVGLPAAIDRLASTAPQYRLAISLHAPHDELRNQLVPVNTRIGLKPILAAADRYFSASGRRLTFEYVLLAGANDRREHAQQLVELLGGRRVLLNIIPYNRVNGLPYRTPSVAALEQFRAVLESAGVTVKVRHRKGSSINAACGQLRFPNQGRGEESSVGSVDDK